MKKFLALCVLISLCALNAMDQKIRVYGSEGEKKTISIPLHIAQTSKVINAMIEDLGTTTQPIPLTNYSIQVIDDIFHTLQSADPLASMSKKIERYSRQELVDRINFLSFYDFPENILELLINKIKSSHENFQAKEYQNINQDIKRLLWLNPAIESLESLIIKKNLAKQASYTLNNEQDLYFTFPIFSNDNKTIVSIDRHNGIISIININPDGTLNRQLIKAIKKNIHDAVLSADGTKIISIYNGKGNNTIEVYELKDGALGKHIQTVSVAGEGIDKIVVSRDGKKMLLNMLLPRRETRPHSIFQLNFDHNGNIHPEIQTFQGYQNPDGSAPRIHSLTLSPNGKTVIATTEDAIYQWINNSTNNPHIINKSSIQIAFSPDGTKIASLDRQGNLELATITDNVINKTWHLISKIPMNIDFMQKYIHFCSNNLLIASSNYNALLYDVTNLSQILSQSIRDLINSINVSPDGKKMILSTNRNRLEFTYIELLTPANEQMLRDCYNTLSDPQAILIQKLNQALINNKTITLSNSENDTYRSLPTEIQMLLQK